jgi:group I intron endonuclease
MKSVKRTPEQKKEHRREYARNWGRKRFGFNERKKILIISGIYILISKIDKSQFYIGASEHLYNRKKQHFKNPDKHPGISGHVKKYGKEDLEFFTIKICKPSFLQFWEQYYISEFQPPLNKFKFASGLDGSGEGRKIAFNDNEFNVNLFHEEHQIFEFLDNYDISNL